MMRTSVNQISYEEENILQKLFSKYFPYWPAFLIAIILGTGMGWLYIQYSTPMYEAKATLLIQDEKKGNEESKLMESLNQISSKKIVENEIEVLQSRTIMQDVATKLNLYTPISEKGRFIPESAFFSSPVIVVSPDPKTLKNANDIALVFDRETNEVVLNGQLRYPLDSTSETPYGQLKFVLNKNLRKTASGKKSFFLSVYSPREFVPELLKSLKVESAGKLSSIVNLSFKDQIPQRAEDVLNQLIASYQESEIDGKNLLAKNTLEFINERLALITHDLDTIQQKAQEYKSGSNAVDISAQGRLYLENVSKNDQQLNEVNTQISVLNKVEDFVKSQENGAIVPSTLAVNDPLLSELLTRLNSLELDYEKGKATMGENNPKMVEIRDQINRLKPNVLKNITSQKSSLITIRSNINAVSGEYNSLLKGVPQKERQLIDITREEQTKRSVYDFLLQKKEESEIAYASTVANNKIVDLAHADDSPVSPKKMLILAAFVILFVGLVLLFLVIKESLNGSIMYRQEITSLTEIPIIAEMIQQKRKEQKTIEPGKRSLIAEQFRKLRLSLSFLGINSLQKKILVTSGISGEGKSFVAANLAISMSLTGKKVVLVDMDMNNPSQQKIFHLENNKGVADFLQGISEADEIITNVPGMENLCLITAGPPVQDPSELLLTGKTTDLIRILDDTFDIVIIDTSPMALITDAYRLSSLCDATLYVIRHQYTPKILIKRLDESNHITPIHNPAIVFNGVKKRGSIIENYGYGYGYDYVYGNNRYK